MKKTLPFLYRHWRWTLSVATLLLVALALHSLSVSIGKSDGPIGISLESNPNIGLTPAQVTSIRQIGKWEFLSVQMEEIVDTTHSRLLLPDETLVRIYRGTVRLGVDMGQLSADWFRAEGDTAIVHLPPIRQLNARFIDEARAETFFETGSWDNKAREQLYRRAERRMMQRLRKSNAHRQAEQNGREQMTALMRSFGFRTAVVTFDK